MAGGGWVELGKCRERRDGKRKSVSAARVQGNGDLLLDPASCTVLWLHAGIRAVESNGGTNKDTTSMSNKLHSSPSPLSHNKH